MRNKMLFVVLAFFLCGNLFSQIVVMDVSGKAKFKNPGAKNQTLKAGDILSGATVLKLKKGTTVTLFSNGQSQELAQKGKVLLSDVMKDGSANSGSFDSRFGDFLTAAITGKVDDSGAVSGFGGPRGGGGSGGDGAGQNDNKVFLVLPTGKKVVNRSVLFEWTALEGASSYDFSLFQQGNDNAVHNAKVETTSLELDLSGLNLKEGEAYCWRISPTGNESKRSERTCFVFTGPEEEGKLIESVTNSASFKRAGNLQQSLMKAVAFESLGLHYSAKLIYEDLLKASPNNILVKKMFAKFWWNLGYSFKSEALLK